MNLRHRRPARQGATLIDVATGSMLLAVLLIPSIHLISESQSSHRRLEQRDTMMFEAERLLESTKVALSSAAAFDAAMSSTADTTQNLVITDGPDLAGRIRIAADTSVAPAQLLTIVVDVWRDTDGDGRYSSNEPGETLRTQWASP